MTEALRVLSQSRYCVWEPSFLGETIQKMKLTKGVRKDKQTPGSLFVPVQILEDCCAAHGKGKLRRAGDAADQRIEFKLGNGIVVSLPSHTSVEMLIQLMNGVKKKMLASRVSMQA